MEWSQLLRHQSHQLQHKNLMELEGEQSLWFKHSPKFTQQNMVNIQISITKLSAPPTTQQLSRCGQPIRPLASFPGLQCLIASGMVGEDLGDLMSGRFDVRWCLLVREAKQDLFHARFLWDLLPQLSLSPSKQWHTHWKCHSAIDMLGVYTFC